jgi:decaprenyl-phosphate phosphoribosyltransferase
VLRAARPKQWAKNLLVAAAPGAAGILLEPDVLLEVVAAFVAFCLVSSGTYLLNDAGDAESDRRHPTKYRRPIAAGVVSVRLAVLAGVLMLVGGIALAVAVSPGFAGLVAFYVALTTAYTLWLKHLAVMDLVVVAAGYVIRAVAGGLAVGVPISRWFLIVASFGSLFMVAGKRGGEHLDLGDDRNAIRATLAAYSRDYLRYVWTMASGVTLTAYCLWAFEEARSGGFLPWYELTIAPFVIWILRYALLLENGKGATPEDIVLGDRTLQVVSVVWVALFAAAVYVGR